MRRSADPALTFVLGTALALLVSSPTVVRTGHGTLDISDAAVRFVTALLGSWFAVHSVAALVAMRPRRTASSRPRPPGTDGALPEHDAERRRVEAA
jgi:hypothetical protein